MIITVQPTGSVRLLRTEPNGTIVLETTDLWIPDAIVCWLQSSEGLSREGRPVHCLSTRTLRLGVRGGLSI